MSSPSSPRHNRQPLELKMIWKSLTDFDLYPLYLIGLTFGIAGYRQYSPSVSPSEKKADRPCARSRQTIPPDLVQEPGFFDGQRQPAYRPVYRRRHLPPAGYHDPFRGRRQPSVSWAHLWIASCSGTDCSCLLFSFVCMAENLWFLPPLIALVLLPSVSPWAYFSLATVLLSFPYVQCVLSLAISPWVRRH